MNKFTPDELRRAIVALAIIDEHGDPDEWAIILREARDSAPAGGLWGNATPNQQSCGSLLASRLSQLLGAPREQCEMAAADVFAPQRHRAAFDAIMSYSGELRGGKNISETAPQKTRPAVRIIADCEGVA